MTYKTKETAIKHLQRGESFNNRVFDYLREDPEVVHTAMLHDNTARLPTAFSKNKELVKQMLHMRHLDPLSNLHDVLMVDAELLSDKIFITEVLTLVRYGRTALAIYLACSDEVKNYKPACMALLEHGASNIYYMPSDIKKDFDILDLFVKMHKIIAFTFFRDSDRVASLRHLGLPDADPQTLNDYMKALRLSTSLNSEMPEKENTAKKVKI